MSSSRAGAVGVLVGPGVVAHAAGVRALAERTGSAVINTWGAKGVLRWDAPHHGGTAGLQERDFELAGLGQVDLLLTSGLDPAEVTRQPWAGRAEVVDIAPEDLAAAAAAWDGGGAREPVRPLLYEELAAVIGPLYDDPRSPAAWARALSEALPDDGLVVATPGPAGFWVARTWPTTRPGSVVVPARDDGGAARIAFEGARAGRPTTLVCHRPPEGDTDLTGVRVVVWDGDLSVPDLLLEVAGPVVAWT